MQKLQYVILLFLLILGCSKKEQCHVEEDNSNNVINENNGFLQIWHLDSAVVIILDDDYKKVTYGNSLLDLRPDSTYAFIENTDNPSNTIVGELSFFKIDSVNLYRIEFSSGLCIAGESLANLRFPFDDGDHRLVMSAKAGTCYDADTSVGKSGCAPCRELYYNFHRL